MYGFITALSIHNLFLAYNFISILNKNRLNTILKN
jgi:hypothetical protein